MEGRGAGEEKTLTTRETVTVEECARILGISRNSAYLAVQRGEIKALKLGRRLVVPRLVIDQMLAGTSRTEDETGHDPLGAALPCASRG